MKKKYESKIDFDENIAKGFHKTKYYEANEFREKNLEFIEEEKKRTKTLNKNNVTKKIKEINEKGIQEENKTEFRVIHNIYKKNLDYEFGKTNDKPTNDDLINLIGTKSMLMVSYNKVRKNKGAMTKAAEMDPGIYNQLDPEKKSWINKTAEAPDGISEDIFNDIAKFIKENKYPWGCSKRTYVDKPGKKNAKRPITSPPFIDKVIQESITSILHAIYEPIFEKQNCSLGFRPNKGVHDAILILTGANASGMTMALEGDIKSAYDKVSRRIFLKILHKRIKDKKFIKFIAKRLNYRFYDSEKKSYVTEKIGIPQGGIDAPYYWNIYMSVFDEWINNYLKRKFERLNKKVRNREKGGTFLDKNKRLLKRRRSTIISILKLIRNNKKTGNIISILEDIKNNKTRKQVVEEKILDYSDITNLKEILTTAQVGKEKDIKKIVHNFFKMSKDITHKIHKLPAQDLNKLELKFIYVRYADDFIILTNAKKTIMEKIKKAIAKYLRIKLEAELSLEKTLITDLRKESAHFLGFEIKTYKQKKIGRYKIISKKTKKTKTVKAITAGSRVFALPDRQRLINRLHMKGYCNKIGFPKEIGFLSFLEIFSIIERYNSVLRGFANYYVEFIKNPNKNLSRWYYIIKYSCIKTIAQKLKTSIRKVFKQYGTTIKFNNRYYKTIQTKVKNTINGITYEKVWTLLTIHELISKARSLKMKPRLNDILWQLRNNQPCIYEDQDKKRITNDNFIDKLNWTNIRTQSSFDLPCSICGSEENIQMHHIKHTRKNKYSLIDNEKTWLQVMYLRNRKQIPLCYECHINIVHKGRYGGQKLSQIAPKIMYDNRIISIESYIKKGKNTTSPFNPETLLNKGWEKKE